MQQEMLHTVVFPGPKSTSRMEIKNRNLETWRRVSMDYEVIYL